MKNIILAVVITGTIASCAAWFARDYIYWRYDRICIEAITDSEVEGLK